MAKSALLRKTAEFNIFVDNKVELAGLLLESRRDGCWNVRVDAETKTTLLRLWNQGKNEAARQHIIHVQQEAAMLVSRAESISSKDLRAVMSDNFEIVTVTLQT
jgi:hypothetical protein